MAGTEKPSPDPVLLDRETFRPVLKGYPDDPSPIGAHDISVITFCAAIAIVMALLSGLRMAFSKAQNIIHQIFCRHYCIPNVHRNILALGYLS